MVARPCCTVARDLANEPITLEDLAAEFNVSRRRVRKIEVRAFEKVRRAPKNRVAETRAPAAAARVRSSAESTSRLYRAGAEMLLERADLPEDRKLLTTRSATSAENEPISATDNTSFDACNSARYLATSQRAN